MMQRKVGIVSFVALALLLSLSGADAKFYKDVMGVNSREPGDQLLWKSTSFMQNLKFFANVHVELRYPQDLPHSNYMLTHLQVIGQEDSGYIDFKPESGGPGTDYMRGKIVLNTIKNGNFQAFLYGKKK